jgi:hypothetical protein
MVGFSKFASLWPTNSVLAGASGTHSLCVCTACHNVKLILEGCKLAKLMTNQNSLLSCLHTVTALGKGDVKSCSTVLFLQECTES